MFVRAGSEEDHVELTSSNHYNDEKSHTIFLRRSRDKLVLILRISLKSFSYFFFTHSSEIVLYVDEERVDSASLKMTEPIGSSRLDLNIGGFGDLKPPKNELPIIEGFTGCISDIIYDNE